MREIRFFFFLISYLCLSITLLFMTQLCELCKIRIDVIIIIYCFFFCLVFPTISFKLNFKYFSVKVN